jgi:hypothetical protein
MNEWQATFKLKNNDELERMKAFLKEKLAGPYSFFVSGFSIIVTSPDEDGIFKIGQFIRHKNPLSRPIFYSVKCIDEASHQILFDSGCEKCRMEKADGKPHLNHHEHIAKEEALEETFSIVKVSGGKITLPKEVRERYHLKDGDKILIKGDSESIRLFIIKDKQRTASSRNL